MDVNVYNLSRIQINQAGNFTLSILIDFKISVSLISIPTFPYQWLRSDMRSYVLIFKHRSESKCGIIAEGPR
jgi:hypothetical protein